MSLRGLLTAIALTATVLSGCISAPGGTDAGATAGDLPDVPGDWAKRALATGGDHDHASVDDHRNLTTPNFRTVGHDPLLTDDTGATAAGNLCGDASETEDGRKLAAVESRDDIAFTLVDVTDPTQPTKLGELVMRTTYVYDLAVVPDGEHVVLITSNPKAPEHGPAGETGLAWRSPCTGGQTVPVTDAAGPAAEHVPQAPMILLVDITDPADPTIVDRHPALGLGHSIHAKQADGRTWILASSVGLRTSTSIFQFFEVADTPAGDRLQPLSTYNHAIQDPPEANRYVGHTDGWIQEHPKTAQTLAYLVAWDSGLIILDISDPMTPEFLGQWDADYDPNMPGDATGNVHSAHPIETLWDGRHYTVIGPEMGGKPTEDRATGIIYVLDTTDPAEPEAVGGWTLPHDVTWDGRLQYSTHYLTVQGQTAFVSIYHAGIWAIDLSGIQPGSWTRLPSAGVYMPVDETGHMPDPMFRWTPTLEEALKLDEEHLLTFDSNTGAWTFTFDEAMALPDVAPSVELQEP